MTREPTAGMSKVLVAAGTRHIRDSLQTILDDVPVVTVIGVVATGSQLLEALHTTVPDIVILDGDLPGLAQVGPKHALSLPRYSGHIIYLESCCNAALSSNIQQIGGIVVDRAIGARDFIQQVLAVVCPSAGIHVAASPARFRLSGPASPSTDEDESRA